MKRTKRKVSISTLPGEPTDGSGRVCIHLFVQDKNGLITETHVLHPVLDEDGNVVKGKVQALPTRGRIACDSKRRVGIVRHGTIPITMRTDDPRGVTCPKCIASPDYKQLMKLFGE